MKIAFIGGGNMGEAMLAAVLKAGITPPPAISVSDISDTRRLYIEQKYVQEEKYGKKFSMTVVSSNLLAVEQTDVVVLAIKPQKLAEVMSELKGCLKPSQLVLSIVAGARTKTLSQGLKHGCIVRAMPNTPAQIGEGMSVWTATAEVTEQQKGWAKAILGAMGREIYVADEGYIDMATAVSGSGPAYFFLVMESLVDAAEEIGLPREIARELVLQTMLGSGHLIQRSGKEPAELRKMVTSPGGTTAEALHILEKKGFSRLLIEAVRAAYDKAKRLGGS
jgi:pyrroline-5-carboxylate reductase